MFIYHYRRVHTFPAGTVDYCREAYVSLVTGPPDGPQGVGEYRRCAANVVVGHTGVLHC